MHPGYPDPGQDPNNSNPSDPFAQPGYGQMPSFPDPYQQQPPYSQNPQQPGPQPQEPQQPTPSSGQPYPGPYGAPQYPPAGYPGAGYPGGGYPGAGYPGGGYPGGGYTVPGMPPGAPSTQNNTLGLLAMIFGILSIPFAVCCGFIDVPLGIAGLVLGILGKRRADAGFANNRGMALAGIICSVIGLVIAVVFVVIGIAGRGNLWGTRP